MERAKQIRLALQAALGEPLSELDARTLVRETFLASAAAESKEKAIQFMTDVCNDIANEVSGLRGNEERPIAGSIESRRRAAARG
jgi:hypothetical protein